MKRLGFETDARHTFFRASVILSRDPRHRLLMQRSTVKSKNRFLFSGCLMRFKGTGRLKTSQHFTNKTAKPVEKKRCDDK